MQQLEPGTVGELCPHPWDCCGKGAIMGSCRKLKDIAEFVFGSGLDMFKRRTQPPRMVDVFRARCIASSRGSLWPEPGML
mmetsp:Transcript_55161/g.155217  ORF Transcript_55161/g.155217 Transcript_55161/m.155217 type:complete len:80 (-) Transcript_55161:65-304(-)